MPRVGSCSRGSIYKRTRSNALCEKAALDWSEFPCGKNPGSKANVEEEYTCKINVTLSNVTMEGQLRRLILALLIVDYIAVIVHFSQTIQFENEARLQLENNVLMHWMC